MKATIKAARTRLRHLAYQIGEHGPVEMRYTVLGDRSPELDEPDERAGSYGLVVVPWKHPGYFTDDGIPMDVSCPIYPYEPEGY